MTDLRTITNSVAGAGYMVGTLELNSGIARERLLDSRMMTDAEQIRQEYARLSEFYDLVTGAADAKVPGGIKSQLGRVRDISGTLTTLAAGGTLDDVALFEIKNTAMAAGEVSVLLRRAEVKRISLPDLTQVTELLDPDRTGVPSFYVYDSYSPELKALRRRIKEEPDIQGTPEAVMALEEAVRQRLSEQLKPSAGRLSETLEGLAQIDILLAKAEQMQREGLIFPTVAHDGTTRYREMFNPYVRSLLAAEQREFQRVDIDFAELPTIVIGANMGGKTVLLETLALAQYLFQFGFGIPAKEAAIDIKQEVVLLTGDRQSADGGLSSFAAEIVGIKKVIDFPRAGMRALALVDEPARSTNPIEGSALVEGLVRIMAPLPGSLVLTTHYDLGDIEAQRLRVRGLENGRMNYTIVEAASAGVPHEALAIAEQLNADRQWLEVSAEILKQKKI